MSSYVTVDLPTATSQQADDNSSESESESETDHFTMMVVHVHDCIYFIVKLSFLSLVVKCMH